MNDARMKRTPEDRKRKAKCLQLAGSYFTVKTIPL